MAWGCHSGRAGIQPSLTPKKKRRRAELRAAPLALFISHSTRAGATEAIGGPRCNTYACTCADTCMHACPVRTHAHVRRVPAHAHACARTRLDAAGVRGGVVSVEGCEPRTGHRPPRDHYNILGIITHYND